MFPPEMDVREEKDAECAAVDTLVNHVCVHKCVNIYMGETHLSMSK